MVAWVSFHCSAPDRARALLAWLGGGCGCGWVEHCAAWSDAVGGFGTLLGPERTSAVVGVCSLVRLLAGCLTPPVCVGVVVLVVGGVVVC